MGRKDPEILKLVEIARHELEVDEKVKGLPPVKRFMIGDGVEDGNVLIPAALVFDRYLKWVKLTREVPLSNIEFFKELAIYSKKKVTGKGSFYNLSPKGFNLTPEYLELVNSTRRTLTSGKRKTKKTRV